MSGSAEALTYCLGMTVFGFVCLLFFMRIFLKHRWTILDMMVILIGGTLPMNLIAATRRSWEFQEIVSLALIGVGGLVMTVFGAAMGMRLIERLQVRNPLARMGLLVLGWIALISIPAVTFSLFFFAFIIFDRRRDLIPITIICASTALVWVPWVILESRGRQN